MKLQSIISEMEFAPAQIIKIEKIMKTLQGMSIDINKTISYAADEKTLRNAKSHIDQAVTELDKWLNEPGN